MTPLSHFPPGDQTAFASETRSRGWFRSNTKTPTGGALIVNADDWGRDTENTRRILDCFRAGTISSASAMVFMENSQKAAAIALERGIDVGLHLNLTTPFSGPGIASQLRNGQQRIANYLRSCRLAACIFNPALRGAFEYVVRQQLDEFTRLHGAPPGRIDGHHHMHLCSNVILARLLPAGTLVRRNFSFRRGEKGWINRNYRGLVDRLLSKRHRLTDFFFSLTPLQPIERLTRIFAMSRDCVVEVETHPVNALEYQFLVQGKIFRHAADLSIAKSFAVAQR